MKIFLPAKPETACVSEEETHLETEIPNPLPTIPKNQLIAENIKKIKLNPVHKKLGDIVLRSSKKNPI